MILGVLGVKRACKMSDIYKVFIFEDEAHKSIYSNDVYRLLLFNNAGIPLVISVSNAVENKPLAFPFAMYCKTCYIMYIDKCYGYFR